MVTKRQIRLIGSTTAVLTSDVNDNGQLLDTKVEIGGQYLCTIAGIDINNFINSLNSIILNFKI